MRIAHIEPKANSFPTVRFLSSRSKTCKLELATALEYGLAVVPVILPDYSTWPPTKKDGSWWDAQVKAPQHHELPACLRHGCDQNRSSTTSKSCVCLHAARGLIREQKLPFSIFAGKLSTRRFEGDGTQFSERAIRRLVAVMYPKGVC